MSLFIPTAPKYLFFFVIGIISFTINAQEVKWLSWEKAIKLAETDTNPKKIFVDVYTDWCGWCKKMDKETFQNKEVATYMSEKFYMVKMDGEGKEPIEYQGKTYKFIDSGRRGYHELAAALLQGKMSYPTVIFLDEKQKRLLQVPGYKRAMSFLKTAKFFGDNIYKEKDLKTYNSENR